MAQHKQAMEVSGVQNAYVGEEPDESGGSILESLPVSFEMLLLLPSIITLAVLSIIPLVVMIYLSFHEVNFTPVEEQIFIGLGNFAEMAADGGFWNSWKVTAIYVGGSLGLQLGLGIFISVMLHRVIKGENVFTSIIIMPMMIAPVVVGLIWQFLLDPSFGLYTYLLNQVGLFVNQPILGDSTSAMAAVILMDTWQWTPLIVLIVLARLKSIPEHLYEAARVDGATGITQFRHVTLPLLRPAIAIALLLRSMDLMRYFAKVFITTGGGPSSSTKIVGLYVYEQALRFYNLGYGSATGIVLLIVTILMGLAFVETIMGGAGDDE
ncbi:sugar ABC transporter permease [Haloplanus rallus]|jgi:multiple sugar transport system permease protein|uniref:Sugar ABC transporter permease n=1 Tax=Haloplanus rallus TaxID=1816183 RepID=A0A6B9F624_9EURY|nr:MULTISPECIES: sugar ABC transporter permease [Haloplanus]QGX93801.1 sugar ABC transporter permease [Haloplanus rallus]